jgi:hypothetical protein
VTLSSSTGYDAFNFPIHQTKFYSKKRTLSHSNPNNNNDNINKNSESSLEDLIVHELNESPKNSFIKYTNTNVKENYIKNDDQFSLELQLTEKLKQKKQNNNESNSIFNNLNFFF